MRTTCRALCLALALLLTGLTGCLGGDEASQVSPASNGTPQPGTPNAEAATENLTVARFPIDVALDRTVWANGSFLPHQACNPVGCATGQAVQTTEVTDLPEAVPVRLTATLTFEEQVSVYARPMELSVTSDAATFYTYETDDVNGGQTVTVSLLPDGSPVHVHVLYRGQSGQAPPETYTLTVDLTASPEIVPAGVPVTVASAPGDEIQVTPVTAEQGGQAVLFGPQDEVLGRAASSDGPATLTVPATSGRGSLVLLIPEGAPPARVVTNGTGDTLQALGLEVEILEPQEVQGPQAVSWSFEVDGYPLEAGLYHRVAQPLGVTVGPGNGTLASPEATVATGPLGCGTCIVGEYLTVLGSSVGDPGLVPGTYQATFQPSGSAGMEVGGYLVWYKR